MVNIVKIKYSFDNFLGLYQKKDTDNHYQKKYQIWRSEFTHSQKFEVSNFSKQGNLCNYNMAYNVDKTISMWSPYTFFIGKSKCHFHHTQRVNFHCWDWAPGVHAFATIPAISTSKQRPVLSCLMYPFYNKQTKQSQKYIRKQNLHKHQY